jgi:hypothetical protein
MLYFGHFLIHLNELLTLVSHVQSFWACDVLPGVEQIGISVFITAGLFDDVFEHDLTGFSVEDFQMPPVRQEGHSQDACVLAFTCISKVVELHPGKVSVNRVFAMRGVLGYIAYWPFPGSVEFLRAELRRVLFSRSFANTKLAVKFKLVRKRSKLKEAFMGLTSARNLRRRNMDPKEAIYGEP